MGSNGTSYTMLALESSLSDNDNCSCCCCCCCCWWWFFFLDDLFLFASIITLLLDNKEGMVASNIVNACTTCCDNDEVRQQRHGPFLPFALVLFAVPKEEESCNDRITDTIGEWLQLPLLDSGVKSEAVDDLVLLLVSVTTFLEGRRLKILVNDEFIFLLLLRRVMDRLHEEDLLHDRLRRVVVTAAGVAAQDIIGPCCWNCCKHWTKLWH